MQDYSARLAEYAELREEIRTYLDRRDQTRNLVFLLTLGVIGIESSPISLNYLLFLVSAMMTVFLWHDEIRRLQAVFRIATYIQVFVEPEVPGLNWETLISRHRVQTSWVSRAVSHAEFPTLILVHTLLGALRLAEIHSMFALLAFVVAALLIAALEVWSYRVARYGRADDLERWQRLAHMNSETSRAAATGAVSLAED